MQRGTVASNTGWQYIPPSGPTMGDLLAQKGGGGSRGGGGGGYDPYAAARAAEEARRAAMRAAIEQQYGSAIGSLQDVNHQSMMGLGGWYNEAQGRMNPIYDQNQALTGQYQNQLQELARNASRGVLDQGDLLARDLQAQGAGIGGLQNNISGDVRDILGAGSAQSQYNTRLAQVMGTQRTDNAALLSAILQSAQSTRENTYTQQLARLQGEQAMKLAELA